jgi:arylsulfatase A-like enzyme
MHVIDVVPTILEVTGIPAPETVDGITQAPIEGTSFAYTFDKENATAESRHKIQYFEMMGQWALYNEGWLLSAPRSTARRGTRLGRRIPTRSTTRCWNSTTSPRTTASLRTSPTSTPTR